MKRIFLILTAAVMIFNLLIPESVSAVDEPEISARAAVLISADTGEIIFSLNSDEKLPMASTTKIMTVLLCLESGNLDEEFVVDSDAIKVEGSSMGLQEGDIVTKRALCVGMLLPSGNDAANAAAVKIAGSIGKFADMMNERAEELGMSRTYFVTPSGLEGEGHGSSAYDMAILAREALKNDDFREICSSKTIQLRYGNPPYDRTLTNTNKLLSMYQGVYGVKTGFTDEAGRCLVSACERDGINLICVTLNDGNDWNDHMALYDYGFSKAELISPELPDTFEMNVVGGTDDKIMLQPDSGFTVTAVNDDSSLYSYRVLSSPFVYAPVEEGEQLAELQVMYGEREVCRIPLYAVNEVVRTAENNTENNIFKKLLLWLKKIFMR